MGSFKLCLFILAAMSISKDAA